MDHAGGLENFKGTDIPVYVHEKEIKHAYYSVATKTDIGVYLPKDLGFDINWKPWFGDFLEIAPGKYFDQMTSFINADVGTSL